MGSDDAKEMQWMTAGRGLQGDDWKGQGRSGLLLEVRNDEILCVFFLYRECDDEMRAVEARVRGMISMMCTGARWGAADACNSIRYA
jgi:hypothetical protein